MEIPDAAEVVGFAIRTRHENAVEDERIVAGAADQAVSAPAAAENVVAVARHQEIIPGPADERVITVAGVHFVVARAADDEIVLVGRKGLPADGMGEADDMRAFADVDDYARH